MANVKRVVIPLTAAGLIAAMGIGGAAIAAYLTDSETTTNTFTVGKVKHELEEKHYPGNDSDEVKTMEPGKEIPKDPQVENTGNNDMVSFLRVLSPVADVAIVNDDGTGLTYDQATGKPVTSAQEIFWMKDTADGIGTHANNFDANWVELPAKETEESKEYYELVTQDGKEVYKPISAADAKTKLAADPKNDAKIFKAYVFGYKNALEPHQTTEPIFDKVQMKNIIEGELDLKQKNIVIESYAIQANNIISENAALTTSNMDAATLGKIYDIFINQGTAGQGDDAVESLKENVDARPANSNNDKDIKGDMYPNATVEKLDVNFADTHVKVGQTITPTVVYTVNNEPKTGDAAAGKYTFSLVDPADSQYVEVNATTGAVTGKKLTSNTIKIKGETTGTPKATVEVEITVVNPTEAAAPAPTPNP